MSKIVDQQVQNYGYPLNVAHKYKYQNVYQVQNFPLCRLQPSRQGWPPPFGLELSNFFLEEYIEKELPPLHVFQGEFDPLASECVPRI